MELIKEIVIATHNSDKKRDYIRSSRFRYKILSLDNFPKIGEIEETGSTLLENSFIKARTVSAMTGKQR